MPVALLFDVKKSATLAACRTVRRVDRESFTLAQRFLLQIVPLAASELRRIRNRAARIPDAAIRREALASISLKDFHVHGGCILATFLAPALVRNYVRLVALFETAVDYLDNLCDRLSTFDERDFRLLHSALLDAVDPGAELHDYFERHGRGDGGYLAWLVYESQRLVAALPSYAVVQPYVHEVTTRYNELQSLKHLPPGEREERCRSTFAGVAADLAWWEGAAASGSTVPTFALVFGAARGCDSVQAHELYEVYFPYISALHILLDYFIDQAEDRAHHELNFVACYSDAQLARDGIARIGRIALARAEHSSSPREHSFAVKAMCGFYCSRPEVAQQGLGEDARTIAQAVGVEFDGQPWSSASHALIAPLLRLYRRVIRV